MNPGSPNSISQTLDKGIKAVFRWMPAKHFVNTSQVSVLEAGCTNWAGPSDFLLRNKNERRTFEISNLTSTSVFKFKIELDKTLSMIK